MCAATVARPLRVPDRRGTPDLLVSNWNPIGSLTLFVLEREIQDPAVIRCRCLGSVIPFASRSLPMFPSYFLGSILLCGVVVDLVAFVFLDRS